MLYDNLEIKNQKVLEQKNVIEEKIHEISHSIRATERIQKALAPSASLLTRHFPDAGILYSPKDTVSGDFYWMRRQGDVFLVAAADCTGHGVPGAMLSVLGANLLERVVMEMGETSPEKVLAQLDELTTQMLQQEDKAEHSLDGMDVALCAIDLNTRQVRFAGAHRPLYHIRDGEITEYKGDKRAIGGNPGLKLQPFQLHSVDAQPGDQLLFFFRRRYRPVRRLRGRAEIRLQKTESADCRARRRADARRYERPGSRPARLAREHPPDRRRRRYRRYYLTPFGRRVWLPRRCRERSRPFSLGFAAVSAGTSAGFVNLDAGQAGQFAPKAAEEPDGEVFGSGVA